MNYLFIKRLCLIILMIELTACLPVTAYHLVGGELTYQCLGSNNYTIRLKIFRDCYCTNCAEFDNPAYVFIYNSSGILLQSLSIPFPGSVQLPVYINNPCLAIPPDVCVEEAVYSATVNLPPISGGYHLVHQRCCRNSTILNIAIPDQTGSTYYSVIPDPAYALCNSDPYFNNFPPIALCVTDTLIFDHSATDIDGDSLVYELCAPYSGASQSAPKPDISSPPPPPPYSFVNFVPPYSANGPLNGAPELTIDPQTGNLTGAPTTVGQFVVGVCVKEYRNGVLLSTNKRDFQFNVVECDAVISASMPSYVLECEDYTVNFQNSSSGGTYYYWDFGDGVTSTNYAPVHTYPDTGVYMATLIVNSGWPCADTAYSTVNVYPGMTAGYSYITHCADSDISFTDLSVSINGIITTWVWNFGDGNTSTNQNSQHNYNSGGYYNVTLTTVNDKGCVDVMTQNIYVFPEPQMDILYDTPCEKTLLDFTDNTFLDSGSVVSWLWDIAGLAADSNQNTAFYFAATGFYDISLSVVSDHGCDGFLTETIFIKPIPVSDAGPDTTICPDEAVYIGDPTPTTGYSYNWTPVAGLSNSQVSSPTVSLANDSDAIAMHLYVVSTTLNGCSSTDEVEIGVFPNIHAAIPYQEVQCLPDNNFFFEALGIYGANANISWDFGDGIGFSSSDTVSYQYTDTGSFQVSLTIADNGCTSNALTLVKVYDVPVATFNMDAKVGCDPFTVEFNAYSSNPAVADSQLTFYWNFGDGSTDTIQNPVHTYWGDSTYMPSLTITLGSCKGFEEMTQSQQVSVLPTPIAEILLDPPVASVYDPIVNIIDQSSGADDCYLVVVPGDTLNNCNSQQNYYNPSFPYTDTATHYITQIVTNNYGCSDTITAAIDVLPEYIFFAPSSFTPNTDGINDLFLGKGFGIARYEIFIFDRWGDQIFHSKDLYEGWDGHANGGKKTAQEDVYVYVINIVDIYEVPHKVVGRVALIR